MEKRELKPELVESGDGSHTVKVEELKEHYHSHKGAIQESRYVFLAKGLREFDAASNVSILEVGFGTGLNALLTCLDQKRPNTNYHSLETFPLKWELLSQLNYPELVDDSRAKLLFEEMHLAEWDAEFELIEKFSMKKIHESLQRFNTEMKYDLIYYDAFAPHAQPDLWEPLIWKKLFELMKVDGVLVTYCAKGQVRRDMQAAGFTVERLEGPPGKREMLRARKNG